MLPPGEGLGLLQQLDGVVGDYIEHGAGAAGLSYQLLNQLPATLLGADEV